MFNVQMPPDNPKSGGNSAPITWTALSLGTSLEKFTSSMQACLKKHAVRHETALLLSWFHMQCISTNQHN